MPYAASDREGNEPFLVHEEHSMGKLAGSSGRDVEYLGQIDVKSLRLDDFIYRDGNPCPNIVKIDIEGGGVKAIPGMLRLLSEGRPIVFMEMHGPEEQGVAWDALKQNGYVIHRMERGYPEIARIDALDWKEYINALPHGWD